MLANLLAKQSLDNDDIDQLRGWLGALKEDVAIFGETPQDYNLRRQIETKLMEEQK